MIEEIHDDSYLLGIEDIDPEVINMIKENQNDIKHANK